MWLQPGKMLEVMQIGRFRLERMEWSDAYPSFMCLVCVKAAAMMSIK